MNKNFTIYFIGEDNLSKFLMEGSFIQPLVSSLIGLIPNCASSVLLVELYAVYGTIGFPALVAGLTACAGVGIVILWTRNRKHLLENLGILLLQFAIG